MQPESTLNQLKEALPGGQPPSSYGVYFKNTLVALCHALEDHILQSCSSVPADRPLVLVTFQQGKWYLQEADRYSEIAQCASHIAISALPDSGFASHKTGQLDNVSLIHLDSADPIVEEWNLIILAPNYASMVLCHELSSQEYQTAQEYQTSGRPTADTERKFYGLWTFDRASVEAAATILINHLRTYNPDLADLLTQRQQHIQSKLSPTPADLSSVVARIVTYLQRSQEQLVTVNRQARELWDLEGQALRLNRNLAANKLQAFLRMAQRVDECDRANPVASLQVAALSETLGQMLDLPMLKLRRLRLAGLLFRIGLAEAPVEVFTQSTNRLEAAHLCFWRDRALLGGQLLSSMSELAPITEIVACQLEHWDGSGKPDGLKGEEIPIEARILGLVTYFQELTQARGDYPALSLDAAIEKCRACGSRFDPALVKALSHVVRLTEMGLMQIPDRPSQLPTVWLEDSAETNRAGSEVTG